ncbi:MAG: hypothetical protein O2968_00480 [Acidobacteria bacterium]|nr:hypothetical protein [Acidobacteriota bacterium]
MRPLNDEELTRVLSEWRVPRAPASLDARVPGERGMGWWQWIVRGRIQVPVPLAAAVVLVLLIWGAIGGPATFSDAELDTGPTLAGFELVEELNPRIIRGGYAN